MRPEWAVMRRSIPAAAAAAIKRRAIVRAVSGTTGSLVSGLRLGPERAEGRCYTVLHVPEIGRLTGRVRFRGSDADQDAGGRGVGVGDVGPAKGGDFGSAQPGHEKQPGDHGVQSAAPGGGGLGLDATPGCSRPVARGKDGRKVVGGKGVGPASAAIGGGAPETCEDAAGRVSGRVRVVG